MAVQMGELQGFASDIGVALTKPTVQLALCFITVICIYIFLFVHSYYLGPVKKGSESSDLASAPSSLYTGVQFIWNCFFKPHTGDKTRNQQDALESFYKAQASIYDATRSRLLRGREDMLGLVAAQLRNRIASASLPPKPTWVDLGGGTGYNIEAMSKFVDVPSFFSEVYLIDLSPSLCQVASDRFARLGWKNVKVICEDARHFRLEDHDGSKSVLKTELEEKPRQRTADLITMSYSLSMIPEYYSVIDSTTSLLSKNGVFGVADFYVQSEVDYQARNYTGGEIDRHCMWISRVFWRTWFEADRVGLEAARRDYLEYKYGTILSINARNHMFGLRIPYYVWVGCGKDAGDSTQELAKFNASVTESPFLSALDMHSKAIQNEQQNSEIEVRSKAYDAAIVNLSASLPLPSTWYQAHHWRIHYDDQLQKHRQFKDEYIYAFTWEDAKVDTRVLKIKEDDVILAITSAGDNILQYALEKPKRIHAVDLNPTQNHLLELKLAAFAALPQADVWKLFGEGVHPDFRTLLINKLSPHMSSLAFQYWLQTGPKAFSGNGLYFTGGSRHAISLTRWLFGVVGLLGEVKRLCNAQTLNEQREIWHRSIRRVLLSRLLSWTIISNKAWLWKALGVPSAQREMIEEDYATRMADGGAKKDQIALAGSGRAIWEYAVNTFDPVVGSTLLSNSNHYYLLCLLGHYTPTSCPEYLTPRGYSKLSRPDTFDGLRIHTDEVGEVVDRLSPSTLTIAVVMDSMDWFAPGASDAEDQVRKLRRALKLGGRVMLRSSGEHPWYIAVFQSQGFKCKRVGWRRPGVCIDRVNMYASTWICTKMADGWVNDDDSRPSTAQSDYESSTAFNSPVSSPRRHSRNASSGDLAPLSIGEASLE